MATNSCGECYIADSDTKTRLSPLKGITIGSSKHELEVSVDVMPLET